MSYAFIILDECIDDLESGHSGKRIHVVSRINGLQRSALRKFGNTYNEESREYFRWQFQEYRRILYRLDQDDIKATITMMRELQDEIGEPYYCNVDTRPAWNRFADWRIKSLNEQAS